MSRYSKRRRYGLATDRRVVLTAVGILGITTGALLLRPDTSDAASRRGAGRDFVCQPAAGATASASDGAANQQGAVRPGRNGCPEGTRLVRVNAVTGQNAGSQQAADQGGQQQGGQQQGGQQQGGQQQGGQQGGGQAGGVGAEPTPAEGTNPAETATPPSNQIVNPTSTQGPVGQQAGDGDQPSQEILGNNCDNSRLQPHDGFQNGPRCVSTAFGEVAAAESNPSLLITSAPRFVKANQAFDLRVSTRNLVRDRFLAAAQGGYYKESSFLNGQGLTRGHFHTACRLLGNRQNAPDPAPAPAFFAATEDGQGGRGADTVTVRITGLPRGEAQCAVWAGDGSHRVPMMVRANQIPAFDVVRVSVR